MTTEGYGIADCELVKSNLRSSLERRSVKVMIKDFYTGIAAQKYDETYEAHFSPEAVGQTVDTLAELANGGRALEFGIGTGRIALPLQQRGVEVVGLDSSEDMVKQMRQKPGSESIEVTIGDMASDSVGGEGEFDLVYLVCNTLFNLTTQDEQVECFRNAASHLKSGGYFVVESFFPAHLGIRPDNRFFHYHPTDFEINVDEYDLVTQESTSHQYTIDDEGIELRSIPFRYVWPAEMDLMARMAGMSLSGRWCDWAQTPFTGDSDCYASIWKKDD